MIRLVNSGRRFRPFDAVSKKAKRLILILLGAALAGVVALLVVAYFLEEKLGREEWERVRAEMEARGETFDFAKLAPPKVPDDENFAMTPLLRPLLDYEFNPETHSKTWRDSAGKERAKAIRLDAEFQMILRLKSWQEGEFVSLEEWAAWFRQSNAYEVPPGAPAAEAVLGALRKFDPEIDEISRAAQRPFGRFPVHYHEGPYAVLGHLSVLTNVSKIIVLRASARLKAGDAAGALEDVLTLFRIQWLMREQITVLDHLVTISLFDYSMQPVWEAWSKRLWSDEQWDKVEGALSQLDFLAGYQRAMRAEAAFAGLLYGSVYRNPKAFREISALDGGKLDPGAATPLLFLRGTLYRNQAYQTRMMYDRLLPSVDPSSHRVFVEKIEAFDAEITNQRSRPRPERIFALISLPVFSSVQARSAQGAALCDLARVAVALERCRLAAGTYPATLDALAPRFLDAVPHDVITGELLKYQPAAETFQLYSVGWNTTDDGGELGWRKNAKGIDRKLGDWIWPARRVEPD